MDKYYVMIAGSGQTSRANVEALVEDYVYGHGQDVIFVLIYDKKPSQGQTFVAQLAKDKSKEVLIFCPESASYDGLPASSVSHSDTPLEAACSKLKKTDHVAFVLVDDEDESTNKVLSVFAKNDVPTFDLTEGLMPIAFNPKSVEETKVEMPEAEMLEEADEPEDEEEFEDLLSDIEDMVEEADLVDDVYIGIQALARLIAKEVVAQLVVTSETGENGPTG